MEKIVSYTVLSLLLIVMVQPITWSLQTSYSQQWPPWTGEEPFPWLQYLKQLAQERGEPLSGVTLTIITRHEATIITKTKEVFLQSIVAKELGIENIIPVYAGPEQWETYISQAAERGAPIDVAWGGGPTLFNYIDSLGYIEPLDNNTHPEYNAILYEMTKIPERIAGAPTWKVGDDGFIHWIGAAISSFGFTVNHDKLNQYSLPMPRKWIDLTKPEYAKALPDTQLTGIADPTKSTSNTRMYEIILQAYGWEDGWRVLTLMAANAKIYDSSSGVRDAVTRGDIAVGITIDFYGYTAMHQNPACEYIIPENESIVNADPIAILKDTRYPIHAAAFVAWVLSEYGGQQVWLDTDINRLPINDLVFNTDIGQQRQDIKQAYQIATNSSVILFNETLASLTEKAMQFYFKATLVNAHDDLQAVWGEIAQAYLNGEISEAEFNYLVRKLTDPFPFQDPISGETVTFTLDYAIKINPRLSEGSIYQALMSAWEDGAREKYLNVYDEFESILAGETTIPTSETSPIFPSTTPTGTTTPSGTTGPTETATGTPKTSPTTTPAEGIDTGIVVLVVIILIAIIVAVFYLRR
ncbi:MAG: ABC transporter substrate-binding protein [Desulfurococcales archaeon ex4484_58]|nr:MAG: ABC transporter substrate-binding protein [Desulfurococcales archaeon ex4484_58]